MSKRSVRRVRVATVTGSCLFTVAATLAVPTSASAIGCTSWTPVLTGSTVNQGLGSFTPLVRGKTTLVRLFITEPSCASAGQEQLVSGSLVATETATGKQIDVPVSSTPANAGPVYPNLEASGSTTPDSAGYPEFKLPSFGAADTTTGTLGVTFTARVTYQYPTLSGLATAVANFTASSRLAPKPNALRILVVPMGDASDSFNNEFPEQSNGGTAINGEYADTVVQNTMQTLSRVLPVYDGVGDLTSTSAGLRYTLDDNAIVDLGLHGLGFMNENTANGQPIQPFCSVSSNFNANVSSDSQLGQNTVAGQLAAFRNTWNTNSPSMPVDKVLGVAWQSVSSGSNRGCDEGRAMVNGNVAYIRLYADDTVGGTQSNPSMSGALASMELSHTWGAAVAASGRAVSVDHHSVNTTADPANTQRAYDIKLAKWLSAPVSAMHYSGNNTGYDNPTGGTVSAWNDSNVLMEQPDYNYTQCKLTTGMASTDCPTVGSGTGALGSSAAAAAAVVLAGTTDGTVAGTAIHSYYTSDPATTPPAPPTASYWLQTNGSNGVVNTPLPDGLDESQHGSTPGTNSDVINASVALDGVSTIAVWRGQPPAGATCGPQDVGTLTNCLYARTAQASPPTIVGAGGSNVISNLVDFTNASGNESTPAISRDGKFVAWVAADGIHAQQRNTATNSPAGGSAPSAALAGTGPQWSPDGTHLAFATTSGDIDTVSVTPSGTQPTFGSPQTVYNHLLQGSALGDTSAHQPTWSPDGSQLVAAINGNLFKFSSSPTQNSNAVVCDLANLVDTLTCQVLTRDGGNSSPTWGSVAGSGSGLVAYQHNSDVYTLDPAVSGHPATPRAFNAAAPSWGKNLVAYTQAGNVLVANGTTTDPSSGVWTNVSTIARTGRDLTPSLNGDDTAIAFGRTVSSGNDDVMVGTLGQDQSGPLQFTAVTPGDPGLLEADLYIACNAVNLPIIETLRPNSTQNHVFTVGGTSYNAASFSAPFDESMACPGGSIYARVTDGINLSQQALVRHVPANQPGTRHAPLPAIAAPRPGSVYLQFDPVIAIGSSIDGTTTNKDNTSICWTLTGPSGSGYSNTPVGCQTENEIDPPQQPAPNGTKGWVPGTWRLTVTVTDGSSSSATSVTYTVLPDPGHLGSNVGVSFNPQTLYVPSSGNDVTVTVKSQAGQNLASISASTVKIVQVGNTATSIPVDNASGTNGWVANSDGTYTAKFNRQTLTCLIDQSGLTGVYVPVVISGSGSGLTITGYDHHYPFTSPNTTTFVC